MQGVGARSEERGSSSDAQAVRPELKGVFADGGATLTHNVTDVIRSEGRSAHGFLNIGVLDETF